jgi:hypothetical protein
MSLNNTSGPPVWIRVPILLVSLGGGVFLAWLNYRGNGHFQNKGLLTGMYLLVALILSWTGILPIAPGFNVPFFEVRPRVTDLAKAACFFLLMFVWTALVKPLVPDSPLGAVLLLGPDALLLLASLICVSNSLSR